MSASLQSCELWHARLLCSWNFPGKNPGVDCHSLLLKVNVFMIVMSYHLLHYWDFYKRILANNLFQQHKRRLYTWTSPDGQHRNQTDYILCSQRRRSSIQSEKTRPGANCGSDHELLIVKFRLKLQNVGKTIRPFRYDLNQIPYDYTL